MEQVIARLSEDWPTFGVLIVLLINVFRSQLAFLVPEAVKGYFQLTRDKQEHIQQAELAARELAKFKELANLSASNFVEEQVTQFTAETQVQLNEANSFVRQIVSNKLDMISERLVSLRENIQQIKEIQSFILQEIRGNSEDI